MSAVATQTIVIPIPLPLHRRTRHVAKQLLTSMSQLTRDALTEKVQALENKFREEKEKSVSSSFRKIGESPLGPAAPAPPFVDDDPVETALASAAPPTTAPAPTTPIDPLADIYEHHAQKIFEALADPTEKRIRIEEALAAIQVEYPIIAPPDDEIRTKLQTFVQKLRAEERAALAVAETKAPLVSPYPSPIPPLPPLTPTRFQSGATGRTLTPLKPRYVK